MSELVPVNEGIYRKVPCFLHDNGAEIFLDCLVCKYLKDVRENGNIVCSYLE